MNGDPDIQILHHRVSTVERAIEEISKAVKTIADNTAQIAALEARHAETRDGLERAFTSIKECETKSEAIDERLRVVEVEMPGLKETRRWVVGGILAITAIVGTGLISMVVVRSGDQNVNIRVPPPQLAPMR